MTTVLTIYNLSVQLETEDPRLRELVVRFIKEFYTSVTPGFGKDAPPDVKIYAGYVKDYDAFFFTNKQFKHLNFYLNGIGYKITNYKVIDRKNYNVDIIGHKVLEKWSLRDHQEPVDDFIKANPKGTLQIPLATGTGKTFISINAIAEDGKRFAITILPTFMGKWISDLNEILGVDPDTVYQIRGREMIKNLAGNRRDGIPIADHIIFSLPTIRDFITAFENDPEECEDIYQTTPLTFFTDLGINTILIDEVHLSFHAIFKMLLYCNVNFFLGLSATLIPNNDLEARVYKSVFSDSETFGDQMIRKYLTLTPIGFYIEPQAMKHMRWTGGGRYSHTVFEKSIMRRKGTLESYFRLIDAQLQHLYFDHAKPGDKCIVFVSTKKMATLISKWFAKKYPGKRVERYIAEDDYETMLLGDMIFTTVLSAGTGLDIPGLIGGLQTVSMGSVKSDIQSAGRIREIPGTEVRFGYLYCFGIPKQREFHNKRLETFANRTKKIDMLRARETVTL